MNATRQHIAGLFDLPFFDLLHQAHSAHRAAWPKGEVQLSTLLSIKTGACVEDCGYCAQSARYDTPVAAEPLMDVGSVLGQAQAAKDAGATRFCMGAAWREVSDKDLPALEAMVSGVKGLGLETCMTLGMMNAPQAGRLKQAGLDYYNHNLDSSREFYPEVIGTRTYDDRLDTLKTVRDAGMKVCSGGILGMGERREAPRGPALRAGPAAGGARERAHQPPGAHRGHAGLQGRGGPDRPLRIRALHRGGALALPPRPRPALRRPRGDEP